MDVQNIQKIKIVTLLILIMLLVIGILFYVNKASYFCNANKEVVHLSAKDFLEGLKDENPIGDNLLVNRVVEVSGVVRKVNHLNERYTILLSNEVDKSPYIICDMKNDQIEKAKQIKLGDTISLKGQYKGFLKDAILLNCEIYNR